MKNRIVKICALSVLCLASFASCKAKSAAIRIGSKDFTENLIVAELYALALEDNGYAIDRIFNLASSAVHTTIVNNNIDLYPEYTGTGLLAVLKHDLVTNPDEVYTIVRDEYKKQFNLVWLPYAPANDGQGLVITKKAADAYGIKTISDLQRNVDQLRFASQGEFDLRDDGIPALEAKYGRFNWRSSRVYDNSLKYTVLENDEADVAPAYTTEGALTDPRFVLLVDDKEVWPPYNLAPVIRGEILDANPSIASILAVVNKALTTESITALNAKVDLEQEEYEDVAKKFYASVKNL